MRNIHPFKIACRAEARRRVIISEITFKVKQICLPANNPTAKKFRSVFLLAAALLSAWTIYAAFSFTPVQFLILLISLAVSALVNQHELTLPLTRIRINAADFTVFAGILLLGVPGGVLLAASVAAVCYRFAPEDKNRWILDSFAKVTSALAAGTVFGAVIEKTTGLTGNFLEEAIPFNRLILAAAFSALTYRVTAIAFNVIFYLTENGLSEIRRVVTRDFSRLLTNSVFGLAAALALCAALIEFGLPFGAVILLGAVVGHYAYVIHNSRLNEKTREISEASRIHLATVEALATAIDARDQIGIGHVSRTQIYAVGIGEMLNLSADELKALNTGALLHDIGKLAVPDHILNKPGKLTTAEMEKIKIHAAVGASILEKVNFSYPVVPTVKYHHEAWDGSGYPEGLKGEEIPLTARVLAVADAYDTLRGARPYRPAVSREDARRFLLDGAGTQFDRKIVDVFLRNIQQFETEIEAQELAYLPVPEENPAEMPPAPDAHSDESYVEQIKRANREVYTLYELARVLGTSLNLEETLSLFVKKIGELVPFDNCVVYLMEKSPEVAKAAYVAGDNKHLFKDKRVRIGEGGTGGVLKKRQADYKINPNLDFSYNQPKPACNYSAMISLPLIGDERMLGAVSLYSHDLKTYEEEQLRLLETVARIAADAIGMSLQHAESENRALTDPMTNLPNARSLQMQFEKEVARADRHGKNFQVLMLDLDGFKSVNDTFGHQVGDQMLKEIARVMRGQLRDYDFLARYAGDEFVAIVPETDAREIYELCQRIEKAVFDFVLPVNEGQSAQVGVSIGAACYPQHGETLDQVIVAADKAMYAVKGERKAERAAELRTLINKILATENFTKTNYSVELDESHIVSSAVN